MQLAPFPHSRDSCHRHSRAAGGALRLDFSAIGKVETGQIFLDPPLCEFDPSGELLAREVASAAVHSLVPRAVHCRQLPPEQVKAASQQYEGPEQRLKRCPVCKTEICDRGDIGAQTTPQPDHLKVARSLGRGAPARPRPIEIAVKI